MTAGKKLISFWLISFLLILFWSGFHPHDYLTWILEVAPALIAVCLLIITYRRFKFTPLAYWLIWIHCIILMIGGHYTYAEMPLFNWLKDVLNLSRNHYDRLGHIAQGFVPAIIARELLIRTSQLAKSKWLFFVVVCICLAASAFYELIEWQVALLGKAAAEHFLATQGDIWDTQADMAMALAGAIVSLLGLSKIHDKQLSAYCDLQRKNNS